MTDDDDDDGNDEEEGDVVGIDVKGGGTGGIAVSRSACGIGGEGIVCVFVMIGSVTATTEAFVRGFITCDDPFSCDVDVMPEYVLLVIDVDAVTFACCCLLKLFV